MKVTILEFDADLRECFSEIFRESGHEVTAFGHFKDFAVARDQHLSRCGLFVIEWDRWQEVPAYCHDLKKAAKKPMKILAITHEPLHDQFGHDASAIKPFIDLIYKIAEADPTEDLKD
jgi:hypothetical protein